VRRSISSVFLVAAIVSAGGLGAQEAPAALPADTLAAPATPLVPGARSLAFSISGSGSGAFGYWRMRSERLNTGWEVSFYGQQEWSASRHVSGATADRTATHVSVGVGPRFRRYAETTQRVAPFAESGLSLGYGYLRGRDTGSTGEVVTWNVHTGALVGSAGLGLEWFPTDRVSASGFTGVSTALQYMHGTSTSGSHEALTIRAGTFTTGLSLRIYLAPDPDRR
jgi:hypothetical protein